MKRALQRGFTLIELLVVITIIAILASLAVPTFGVIQDMATHTSTSNNCRPISMAMTIGAGDNTKNVCSQETNFGNAKAPVILE